MIKNYIKLAWRNLIKDKQFTFLNLLGLSTGLACTILISLWVNDELHIDKFNENDKRLFQIIKTAPNADGTVSTFPYTQGLLAEELARAYPEIEYASAVRRQSESGILSMDDKRIKASWILAGKDFLNIFSYRLLEGSLEKANAEKYGVLISEKLAKKLFNSTNNIVGKTIKWEAESLFSGTYTISGVFEAPPANATDQFDLVLNYLLYAEKEIGELGDVGNWGSNGVNTYLLLKKGTDAEKFSEKIKGFTKAKIKSLGDEGLLKWEGDLLLQRYSEKYLYNRYENGKITGGRIEYVQLFSIIAIFILIIACINFMNLSTAKAAGRMKETGIRKVVGASRKSLILQFMGESSLMALLATAVAIGIVSLLLPLFSSITGKHLSLEFSPAFVMALMSIALITGLIAGSYPALYVSSFKPVSVLKGKLKTSIGESIVRKGLVVFQFTISVILIIAVLVVYKQMNLLQTKNLGYNKDNVVTFPADGRLQENLETFITEVKKVPGVINASAMSGNFSGTPGHGGGGISWEGKDPNLGIEYYGVSGDYGFMEMLGIKVAAGRTFSPEFGYDSSSVIFNETAIATMGIKDPIGKIVSLWGKQKKIIGVVKDYHFEPMYQKIRPAFIEYDGKRNETVLVKIKAGSEREALVALDQVYKKFNQGLVFEYRFMDDDYQAMYASEQRVALLSRYFAMIAIIISCLGLFGLSAFTAQKRQKEIGIRKVIGASVSGITFMLSKDFLKLIVLSILIAFPAAWLLSNQWLQGFAYRVALGYDIFIFAACAIVAVTLLTISFQSIKAALMNPVKSLRAE